MSPPDTPFWHPRAETMSRAALESWQCRKLQAALEQAERSPFWAAPAGLLPASDERRLRACYATLHRLAATCPTPSVRAAARSAPATLHAALDGEALHVGHYSHRWAGTPAP